jgi:hypothetical protein
MTQRFVSPKHVLSQALGANGPIPLSDEEQVWCRYGYEGRPGQGWT